jgi:hypothetical protein
VGLDAGRNEHGDREVAEVAAPFPRVSRLPPSAPFTTAY